MTTVISVDRTALSLSALTLTDMPASSGFWVVSVSRPAELEQRTYATSPWVDGQLLTASTTLQGALTLGLYGVASSTAALNELKAELRTAFKQFNYTLSLTLDGETETYTCDRADLTWGDVVRSEVAQHLVGCTIAVPTYPPSSSMSSSSSSSS